MKTKIDYGYISLTKFGEQLCGDNVEVTQGNGVTAFTMADGLGSGVKANILSMMTSKILSTMLANNVPIEECVDTIAETLPVCKVRNVAYSTFTSIVIDDDGNGYMIEFDNPDAILVRRGKCHNFDREKTTVSGKTIYRTKLKLEVGDYIVVMSDGATHAGVGITLNSGWRRESIMEHLDRHLKSGESATELALMVTSACNDLYLDEPSDDTTCLAVGLIKRRLATVMIGPPTDKESDENAVNELVNSDGIKIVCGGTTARIVAGLLQEPIDTNFPIVCENVPPISAIKGIDLVTEGAVTIGEVLKLANEYNERYTLKSKAFESHDGASIICDYLFNYATDVHLIIGQAINLANSSSLMSVEDKQNNISGLISALKKSGKDVTVTYY